MDFRMYHGYKIYEDGTIVGKYGKIVKKRIHNGKYEVRLIIGEHRKNVILSRLMYWLFVENFDLDNRDLCVCAKDDNFLNIYPSNLYLEERKNLLHGEKHKKRSKLTDEQIQEILETYKPNPLGSNQHSNNNVSYAKLAEKYGVTKGNIAMVVKGRSRNKDKYKLK